MALLLNQKGDDIQITEEVLKAAAENLNGYKVMALLLDRRADDIQIQCVQQSALSERSANFDYLGVA